jgi:hypothetical protein
MTISSWKHVLVWLAVLLPLWSLAGPGCEPPGDDDDDSGDDDNAGDDDAGFYQEGIFGLLTVHAGRNSNHGNLFQTYSASAQFFEVVEAETMSLKGYELDPDDGLDDCSLHWYTGEGLGNPGDIIWWGAAAVTVTSGPQSAELDEFTGGEVIGYDVDLGEMGYDPRWGEGYAFQVVGAQAPSLDLDPAIVLPEQLQVSQPDITSGAPLPRDDLLFQWSGSGDEPVELEINGYETSDTVPPWYEIRCQVADDGEFLVPGSLMQQLPAGGTVSVTVSRNRIDVLTNDEGLDILTSGWVFDRVNQALEP